MDENTRTLFNQLFNKMEQRHQNKLNKKYSSIVDILKKYNLEPDIFDHIIMNDLRCILHEVYDSSSIYLYYQIYINIILDFFDRTKQDSNMITNAEKLITIYDQYKKSKVMPDLKKENILIAFGTTEEWMSFLDGISKLIEGDVQSFLQAYKVLLYNFKILSNNLNNK